MGKEELLAAFQNKSMFVNWLVYYQKNNYKPHVCWLYLYQNNTDCFGQTKSHNLFVGFLLEHLNIIAHHGWSLLMLHKHKRGDKCNRRCCSANRGVTVGGTELWSLTVAGNVAYVEKCIATTKLHHQAWWELHVLFITLQWWQAVRNISSPLPCAYHLQERRKVKVVVNVCALT